MAIDMNGAYQRIPAVERQGVEKIEWLDELEEWVLINSHYIFSLALLGPAFAAVTLE